MKQFLIECVSGEHWHRRILCALGVTLLVAVTLYGRFFLANASGPVHLVVYAFSTQEEVLTQGIFPAFEQAWEAETGRDLTIEGVFGPSGTLAGQINLGAPADVALFSNAQHVSWLKLGKCVAWDAEPLVIGYTPMVIITRPGNPDGLASLADLSRDGLVLVHADPRSSGAGEWSVLAEYGSALLETGDRLAAQVQLEAIWRNVRLLSPSARAALTLFELGAGDALVTYEQDARLAMERGVPLEIVLPPRTIVAEHVAIVVDENVTAMERPAVEAFVQYLQSPAGQRIFVRYYLRGAVLGSEGLPPLDQPFRVEDLGGWSEAYIQLVETLWQSEIEPRLNLEPAPRLLDSGSK